MLGFNNFTPSLFNLPISYLSISNPSLSYDYKCCSAKKINKYSFFLSFCLLWKGRSKRKHKRFDIKAYYRNKTKTFWFGLLIIGTKAERFNLFQNYLKTNRNVFAFFKVQKRNQNETELISYRIETFPYTYASEETKRNFCELFPNFFTSSERFCLLQLLRNQTELLYFQKMISKQNQKVTNCARVFWRQNNPFFCSQKNLETDQNKSFWTKFF